MKRLSFFLLAFYLLSMFLISETVIAQCNNLTLSLTPTNSTCLSNGKIKVTVGGSDLANIDQSSMQLQLSGSQNIAFAQYTNNTIENLPAGNYTVSLRAFCNATGLWSVIANAASTTITTSYRELSVSTGLIMPSLSCKPTGMIPIIIGEGTGFTPFTVNITQSPAGYSGQVSITTSDRNLELTDLPVGTYILNIIDDCGYTVDRTIVVDTYIPPAGGVFAPNLIPAFPISPYACDIVDVMRNHSTQIDRYYFDDYSKEYFEVAFLVNDAGTKTWQTLEPYARPKVLLAPHTIKTLRESSSTVTPYLRVKGTSCEFKLNNLSILPFSFHHATTSIGCDILNLTFQPHIQTNGVLCYPYKWRILNSDNTLFHDWQLVFDDSPQHVPNIPLGSKLEIADNEDVIHVIYLPNAFPSAKGSNDINNFYIDAGITDGFVHSRPFINILSNKLPSGTRIRFISGPMTPVHTDITLTDSINSAYIFAPDYSVSTFAYVKPGIYYFEVTRPGGCPVETVQLNMDVYKVAIPASYTLTEVCDGLEVVPTAGKLELHHYDGAITHYNDLYYRINSSIPSNLIDNSHYIQKGGTFKLTQPGQYMIGIHYQGGRLTPPYIDTITYAPVPFSLDEDITSAYLCQGEPTGFIRVKGKNGSGNYRYELYDNNVLKQTNTTGAFSYGTAGSTYKIILYDVTCNTSYPQDVTLTDLGIAQIAYTNMPDDKFCSTDSIYLKCLTLGETTYTWSGPGINATNKNQQNPVIYAGDLGTGIHTFTIRVTPETCGTEMQRTVTVQVQNCSTSPALITANGTTICSGDPVSLSASLATPGSVTNPEFKWYTAQTGGTAIHTGATYTPSPNLTTTTTYYVSVSGTSHSESSRKAVTVTVTPLSTPSMIKVTAQ